MHIFIYIYIYIYVHTGFSTPLPEGSGPDLVGYKASGNISYGDGGWHAGRGAGVYYSYTGNTHIFATL
jgi:hypothetical protein